MYFPIYHIYYQSPEYCIASTSTSNAAEQYIPLHFSSNGQLSLQLFTNQQYGNFATHLLLIIYLPVSL